MSEENDIMRIQITHEELTMGYAFDKYRRELKIKSGGSKAK